MQLNPGRSARGQWQKLSAPIERLIELGLLDPSQSIFDYGCGQGLDIQYLRERGFTVRGWDPYWRAGDPLVESDVVILNFVLDCIGDPTERREALQRAWSLAGDYLMVTVRRDRALVRVYPYSEFLLLYQVGTLSPRSLTSLCAQSDQKKPHLTAGQLELFINGIPEMEGKV